AERPFVVAFQQQCFPQINDRSGRRVVAAAEMVWVKPGSSQNDFAQDRYRCLRESQQRVGGAFVNQYGGAASDSVVTNEQLFSACMNSRGWAWQSKAQLAAAGQSAVQESWQAQVVNCAFTPGGPKSLECRQEDVHVAVGRAP